MRRSGIPQAPGLTGPRPPERFA